MLLRAGLLLAGGFLAGPSLAQSIRPAELPPSDYAGQQYVDSKGCMFLRAGTPGKPVWVPRVTRQGAAVCGNPPSGRRVAVAEEGAVASAGSVSEAVAALEGSAGATGGSAGGHFVAVGSFGKAANADRAVAKLRALSYPAARRPAPGGKGLVTVLAGPFDTAEQASEARRVLIAQGFEDAVLIGP